MSSHLQLEGPYVRTTLQRMFRTLNVIEPAVPDDLSIKHCPSAFQDILNWQKDEVEGTVALAVMIEALHRGQSVQCRTTHEDFVSPGLLLSYRSAGGPSGSFLEALLLPTMTGGLVTSVHQRVAGAVGERLYGALTNRVICSYQNFHIARPSRGEWQPNV